MADKFPASIQNNILHSTLTNDNLMLLASDIASSSGLLKGNNVSLMLQCSSENQIIDCYAKLSDGGVQNHPLEDTFWGALFGGLTDKYGHEWVLNFDRTINVKP
jgi:PhnB protein